MNLRSFKILSFFLLFVLIITSLFLFQRSRSFNTKVETSGLIKNKVLIGGTEINVEIADTPEKSRLGLGKRQSLGAEDGMLFVFPKNSQPIFWMKDMLFPIDIVWINDGSIVKIDKNVLAPDPLTPDEKLIKLGIPIPIDYVLEVNAGFCESKGIKVGDEVKLPIPE